MTPRQTDELNARLRAAIERLLEPECALAGDSDDSVEDGAIPAGN
jgi:hypothetical protein